MSPFELEYIEKIRHFSSKKDYEHLYDSVKDFCFYGTNDEVYSIEYINERWNLVWKNVNLNVKALTHLNEEYHKAIKVSQKYDEIVNHIAKVCSENQDISRLIKATLNERLSLEIWQGKLKKV